MTATEILQQYAAPTEQMILPTHPMLQYEGRMDFAKEEGVLWVYPASFVRIRFTGSTLKAVVTNHHGYWNNYMGVLLDGVQSRVLPAEAGVSVLTLCENAGEGAHELTFFKRQDGCHMITIHGFLASMDVALLEPVELPALCMEVYGDSVSAGEVSEAVAYCGQPDPEHDGVYSNSYYSYAWIAARTLHARLRDIAQGGIALLDDTGWYQVNERYVGMWQMYDKIQYNAAMCTPKAYDFKEYMPQIIIVAFGQNDANPKDYMAENPAGEEAKHWKAEYARFLKTLRSHRPDALIVCTTTILEHHPNWDAAIDEVCTAMADEKIHHFLYTNNGTGTKGHIRIPEAEQMAKELVAFIKEKADFKL